MLVKLQVAVEVNIKDITYGNWSYLGLNSSKWLFPLLEALGQLARVRKDRSREENKIK